MWTEHKQLCTGGSGEREIQKQVADGEEVLDPDDTSSVLNFVPNAFNNEFEYECLDELLRLLNAHQICQSKAGWVPGNMYLILGLPRTKVLAHLVWARWFSMRRWDGDSDMPGVPVPDNIGLCKTFTWVTAAMIWKLLMAKVVMRLLLSLLGGNTPEEWVNMVQNDYPGIISREQECYLLETQNSVPCHLLEIPTTPPQGHPALTSALETIVVDIMPRVAETFNSVIDKMTDGTDFNLLNMLHGENVNHTHEDLNTSIVKSESRWKIHPVLCDTLTSRAK